MKRFKLLVATCCITICSSVHAQSSQQPKHSIQLPEKTAEAGRLSIERNSYFGFFSEARGTPDGYVEAKLSVNASGSVQKYEKSEGSDALWFALRNSWRKLRFNPAKKDDIGPWEVLVVVSSSSSGSGGMLEARATGSSSSSSSKRLYIADVKSVPSTTK